MGSIPTRESVKLSNHVWFLSQIYHLMVTENIPKPTYRGRFRKLFDDLLSPQITLHRRSFMRWWWGWLLHILEGLRLRQTINRRRCLRFSWWVTSNEIYWFCYLLFSTYYLFNPLQGVHLEVQYKKPLPLCVLSCSWIFYLYKHMYVNCYLKMVDKYVTV